MYSLEDILEIRKYENDAQKMMMDSLMKSLSYPKVKELRKKYQQCVDCGELTDRKIEVDEPGNIQFVCENCKER